MTTDILMSTSMRGSHHEQRGSVCQDASGHLSLPEVGSHLVVVADGHGDPSCLRSERGSKIAVDVTTQLLASFARKTRGRCPERAECSELTAAIVLAWRDRVTQDYAADPISELEEALASDDPISAVVTRWHLYGTTLVAALITPQSCLVIQQGDGCCAVLFDDATTIENDAILPADELCVGNITTSLSDTTAPEEIRYAVIDYAALGRTVAACLVATDGIEKSLPPEGGASSFLLRLVLERLSFERDAQWNNEFAKGIRQLSDNGSGDDASAACYLNRDKVRRMAPRLTEQLERTDKAAELQSLLARRTSMQRKRDYYLSEEGRQKVSDHERASYLAKYDEVERMVHQLERELAQDDALPAPPTDQLEPEEPISPAAASKLTQTQQHPTPSPTPVAPEATVAQAPVPVIDKPRRALPLPLILGVAALALAVLVGIGISSVLHSCSAGKTEVATETEKPTPKTDATEQTTNAPEPEPQPKVTTTQRASFLVQQTHATIAEVLATDERAIRLADAGVQLQQLQSLCEKSIAITPSENFVDDNEASMRLTLSYSGIDVSTVLDEAIARLDGLMSSDPVSDAQRFLDDTVATAQVALARERGSHDAAPTSTEGTAAPELSDETAKRVTATRSCILYVTYDDGQLQLRDSEDEAYLRQEVQALLGLSTVSPAVSSPEEAEQNGSTGTDVVTPYDGEDSGEEVDYLTYDDDNSSEDFVDGYEAEPYPSEETTTLLFISP